MNQAAADLLASRLPTGLPHPGDNQQEPFLIPLPAFRATGMLPDQAEEMIGASAKLIAEAIVNLLETDGGFEIIPRHDLQQLQTQAAEEPDGTRVVHVHCHCDTQLQQPLFDITIDKTDRAKIYGRAIIQQLANLTPECPHQEKP